ncbi:MAG TPA: carbohydrate ABC transporter permease, partial [Mycobacterium sp.]
MWHRSRQRAAWALIDLAVVAYALIPVLWILSLSLKPTSTIKDGKLIP